MKVVFKHVVKQGKLTTFQEIKASAAIQMIQKCSASVISKKIFSPNDVINMAKKCWAYKAMVTQRLVPHPSHLAAIDKSSTDWIMGDSVIGSVLLALIKHFSKEEVADLFNCLDNILRYAEPHAARERWDEERTTKGKKANKDDVLKVWNWIPLEVSEHIC